MKDIRRSSKFPVSLDRSVALCFVLRLVDDIFVDGGESQLLRVLCVRGCAWVECEQKRERERERERERIDEGGGDEYLPAYIRSESSHKITIFFVTNFVAFNVKIRTCLWQWSCISILYIEYNYSQFVSKILLFKKVNSKNANYVNDWNDSQINKSYWRNVNIPDTRYAKLINFQAKRFISSEFSCNIP